jgi:DNA-binding transcriptional regulator YiaG
MKRGKASPTAASWEKGRRHLSGAAVRLLQIARQHPEILLRAAR